MSKSIRGVIEVENFLSIKNRQELSMVATNDRDINGKQGTVIHDEMTPRKKGIRLTVNRVRVPSPFWKISVYTIGGIK